MKVLVLGGTGYLGHHVAHECLKSGHIVTLVIRNTSQVQDPFYAQFNVVVQDFHNLEAWLPEELKKVDAVIYCIGETFKFGQRQEDFHGANVDLTKRFFAAVLQFPSLRTVYVSSMAAIAGTQTPEIQHAPSPYRPVNWHLKEPKRDSYDATKRQGEKIARSYIEEKCDIVIVNPGLMWGPRIDHQRNLSSATFIVDFLKGKLPAYLEGGHSFCDVRDVAYGIVQALVKGKQGTSYILGGHNMALSVFLKSLLQVTDHKMPIRFPKILILGIARIFQFLSDMTVRVFKNPLPLSTMKSACSFYFADSSLSQKELDYRSRPFKETARDFINFLFERQLLPSDLSVKFDKLIEPPSSEQLLHQLITKHYRATFLQKNQKRIEEVFATNHALEDYLEKVYACSFYNPGQKRFLFSALSRQDRRELDHFFEYLYFSSNDFLNSLLKDVSNGP